MTALKYCLTTLIWIIVGTHLFAGVDVNVYDEAVYLYLDKLNAGGLLEAYMPNMRPLSRSAVTKYIAEARRNIMAGAPLEVFVKELEKEFCAELSGSASRFIPLDSASLTYTATNQRESPVPDNGMGSTTGRVQPLLSYKAGDHFGEYANFYASTVHRITATPFFAAYLQPKYFTYSGEDSGRGIGLYRGYVKAGYADVEVEFGRDDLRWGPGENALFFSGNAHGLDMLKISSPGPFQFPGFFKSIGHWRATAFVSRLGGDFNPRHAYLSGYRLELSPFRWWNLGFDHAVFMGGEGAKNPTAGVAMKEFIGFMLQSGNSLASSNHLMGMDTTILMPQAMGMQLYSKLLLEDTRADRGYMLTIDSSWLGGVYLPRIHRFENLSVRGEVIYTGQISYLHGFYSDGFTIDNKFIGYDAGPDTYSGFIASRYQFNFDEFINMDFRYLSRSSNHYANVYGPGGHTVDIVVDGGGPDEDGFIMKLAGQKRLKKSASLYVEVGYERRSNAEFVKNQTAHDFSFQTKIVIHP